MSQQFGRQGRRAALAEKLNEALIEGGLAPLPGAARTLIDLQIARVAEQMRMTEAAVLQQFGDREVAQLAAVTATEWHAAQAVSEAAGQIAVTVNSRDAAQLIMGLSMAIGQVIREVYGELPAAAGQPLDALCELGAALRDGLSDEDSTADVTLDTLSCARQALLQAAGGVADGSVPVVVPDSARAGFAEQLRADADLAEDLSGLNDRPGGS